jgi:AraC family transcriptional regulator
VRRDPPPVETLITAARTKNQPRQLIRCNLTNIAVTDTQHIYLWGSRGEDLPNETLFQRVSSSASQSMGELVTEQFDYPNLDLSEVMFKRHVVIMTLNAHPAACEYKKKGRFRRFLKTTGSISIFPSHCPFTLRLDHGAQKFGTAILLSLEPLFLSQVAAEASLDPDRLELIEQRREQDTTLRHVALALQSGIGTGAFWDPLYREALSRALTIHLLREYCSRKPQPTRHEAGLPHAKLKHAIEYIRDRLETALTVAEIAQATAMSTYHFMRLFKKSTGKSPHQYIIEARVKRAKDLLLTGKFSVCEAAYAAGFVDQSHLTRHFKRVFGLPPKALLSTRHTKQ